MNVRGTNIKKGDRIDVMYRPDATVKTPLLRLRGTVRSAGANQTGKFITLANVLEQPKTDRVKLNLTRGHVRSVKIRGQ